MASRFYDDIFLVPSAKRLLRRRIPKLSIAWWVVPSLMSYVVAAVIIFR